MIELIDIAYVRSGAAGHRQVRRIRPRHRRPEVPGQRRTACTTCAPTTATTAWPSSRAKAVSSAADCVLRDATGPGERRPAPGVDRHHGAPRHRRARPAAGGSPTSSPSTTRGATSSTWSSARSSDPSFLELTRPSSGITEFGHICVDAADIVAAAKFWNDNFNVKVSDWVRRRRPDAVQPGAPHPGRVPGRRTGPVPHQLPGRHHRRAVPQLELHQGPQRRDRAGARPPPPVRRAIFLYFKGPEGLTYEYSYGRPPHRGRRRLGAPHLRPHDVRSDRHVGRQLPEALHATADPHHRQRRRRRRGPGPHPPVRDLARIGQPCRSSTSTSPGATPPSNCTTSWPSISRAAVDSLAVPESAIRVLVHEVDPAMWFSGGQTLEDKRRAKE